MPPKKPEVQSATATSSITNTKLAIATAAMVLAAGLAFAAAPLSKSMSYVNKQGQKCGVDSYSVSNSCKKGSYRHMEVTCFDGTTFSEGTSTSCKPSKTWASHAEKLCNNRCTPLITTSSCTDSDGGINIYEQSTGLLGGSVEQKEFCSSENSVYEFYCNRQDSGVWELASQVINCPNGCTNGACIEQQPRLIISESTPSQSLVNGENLVMRLDLTNTGNRDTYDITHITFGYATAGLSSSSTIREWTLYRSRNNNPYIISPNGDVNAQNNEVTFSISPPLIIQAGDTGSVDVMATLYGVSEGSALRVSLQSANDIVTTGDVSQNNFPFTHTLIH